ncbi:serine/threonine-protein kinase [Thermopolyspora sp. NPDC052614]|uniref:serine/threonine-protein kinase n=1 Tax=Thermopolyspora sp. NPDC052614 TaxID=3155682 RepID=UPI0034183BDC
MRSQALSDRYELVEEIDAGAMGQIWRGYDAVLDREVAIKLIRPDIVSSAEQAEALAKRFHREARVTARIRHHGVPQVYDAVLDRSYTQLYLVMELVRGTPLTEFVSPDNPLPISWAVAVTAQIAAVLSHAHAIPVVHRDLKPANVMVTTDGTVKVLDFGIAAILGTDATRLTATGVPMGTAFYMSPEQIQGVQVSPRSDLYALGCILHELCAGTPVFDGGSDGSAIMQQHLFAKPPPLRRLRADVPAELERLTLELLDKRPRQRPRNARSVFERLIPFLPTRGSRPDPAERPTERMPDPTRPYRDPCAPRPYPEWARMRPVGEASASIGEAQAALNAALARSDELLDEGRYSQAADVLKSVLTPVTEALGAENPRVLGLRKRRAAILMIGGDFQRALHEFEWLAGAYSRLEEGYGTDCLECWRQVAYCRAELGEVAGALQPFRFVLRYLRERKGDGDEVVLDLRRDIGSLLAVDGQTPRAVAVLQPLHEDLTVLYGPEHPRTLEVRDLLARLRSAGT